MPEWVILALAQTHYLESDGAREVIEHLTDARLVTGCYCVDTARLLKPFGSERGPR